MEGSVEAEAAIDRLDGARRRHERARRELDEAIRARDAEIERATAVGLSRRRVAEVAGVTGGRVQQILDSRSRPSADGDRRAS